LDLKNTRKEKELLASLRSLFAVGLRTDMISDFERNHSCSKRNADEAAIPLSKLWQQPLP
jgi:hypothetical protein